MLSPRTTLAQRLAPRHGVLARPLVRAGALALAGTLLLTLCARISFPIPTTPVPITMQTFAVLLLSALYGPRLGAATMLLYLAEGLAGLPVFAGGRSELIAEAARRYRELAALEGRLLARYEESLLAIDLPALLDRFVTQHATWSRMLRPQFHRDIAALRAHARPAVAVSPEEAAADLRLALELRAAREWAAAQPATLGRLGPGFAGPATDWEALAADAGWATVLSAGRRPASSRRRRAWVAGICSRSSRRKRSTSAAWPSRPKRRSTGICS